VVIKLNKILRCSPQVKPLVEAVVAKYVALSRDELEEWQEDPEGYIRCVCVWGGGTRGVQSSCLFN
jgi:hypothetical protein